MKKKSCKKGENHPQQGLDGLSTKELLGLVGKAVMLSSLILQLVNEQIFHAITAIIQRVGARL